MRTHAVKIAELLIPLEVKKLKQGDYLATSRILPGLIAQGRSLGETIEIAQDVARKLIESHLEHQDPLPLPIRKQLVRGNKTSHIQMPVAVNF